MGLNDGFVMMKVITLSMHRVSHHLYVFIESDSLFDLFAFTLKNGCIITCWIMQQRASVTGSFSCCQKVNVALLVVLTDISALSNNQVSLHLCLLHQGHSL